MPVICASIPFDDQWPADEDMRNRNAVMKALTDGGIGQCVDSGAGCGVMEFCFEVADVARGRAAFQSLLAAHFPGRGFRVYVEDEDVAG